MTRASAEEGLFVVFGGPSLEHEVSILTGLQALRELKHRALGLYWSRDGRFYVVPAELEARDFARGVPKSAREAEISVVRSEIKLKGVISRSLKPRVVVNCCHGRGGEDGTLQGLFEVMGVAYTGPRLGSAWLAMDKLSFYLAARARGLPVLKRHEVKEADAPSFSGPYVLKPRFGGSSIGVEVVADFDSALDMSKMPVYRGGAVVEPYRPELFDLQIAVRAYPKLELSAIEKPLKSTGGRILNFKDKYVAGEGMSAAPRELPARISEQLSKKVRELALEVAELTPVTGIFRIDFLSDGADELYLNEVNTIPGSLARHLFIDPPRRFAELLSDMIEEALSIKAEENIGGPAPEAEGLLEKAAPVASKLLQA